MAASGMASHSHVLPPIYWPSRRQDRLAIERAKDVVKTAQQVLHECPEPDTFLGRKTHEPFPQAEE
ncbi:hypothetical protein GGD67_005167 [Bradyrhizobium sp. IAR9]|nr:hypothetical protein [Bradyrhizobium sp. IAR9]